MQFIELLAAAALLLSANLADRRLAELRILRDKALEENDWRNTVVYQAELDAAERDANFRLLLGALIAMSVYIRLRG